MDAPFVPPPISTKGSLGSVVLEPAFVLTMDLDTRQTERTARGLRIHQRVTDGTIDGARLQGSVYPNGGGEFGVTREDGTTELLTRLMLRAANGEWLYAHFVGYQRTDGYARLQAMFDADAQGPHAWLNESMFIATMTDAADHRHRTLAVFEAV